MNPCRHIMLSLMPDNENLMWEGGQGREMSKSCLLLQIILVSLSTQELHTSSLHTD